MAMFALPALAVAELGGALIGELFGGRKSNNGNDAVFRDLEQQLKEQRMQSEINFARMVEQNEKKQQEMLAEHHKQAIKAHLEQKTEFERIEKQRKEEAKREMDRVTAIMEKNVESNKKKWNEN